MSKNFVFDLDGTLINTGADLADSMNYALENLGYKKKETAVLVSYIGDGLDNYIKRAFETDELDIMKQAKVLFEEYYRNNSHNTSRLYDDVEETLEKLAQSGIKMFVLSNKPIEFIPGLLEKLSIQKYFQDIIGQYSLPAVKPAPDGLFYFMEKFHIAAEDMLMIGDNYTDIAAGQAAGVSTVFCQFGLGTPGGFQADFSIKQFRELLNFI